MLSNNSLLVAPYGSGCREPSTLSGLGRPASILCDTAWGFAPGARQEPSARLCRFPAKALDTCAPILAEGQGLSRAGPASLDKRLQYECNSESNTILLEEW